MTAAHDLPTITTRYDKQPDGTWATTIVVSGLKTEEMAERAQELIINSFCDGEIEQGPVQ